MAEPKVPTSQEMIAFYTEGKLPSGGAADWFGEIDALIDELPPDALAWLNSLAEFGEWGVPGRGKQNVGEWINFLGTEQGKGWWGSLTEQAKLTLQPDYGFGGFKAVDPTEEYPAVGDSRTALVPVFSESGRGGGPSPFGASQFGSTSKTPMFALPWLRGTSTPSAEHPYGYSPGGDEGAAIPKKSVNPFGQTKQPTQSIYREGAPFYNQTGRLAPLARWLMY